MANEVMSPSDGRSDQGPDHRRRDGAGAAVEGKGAVLDGRLIDYASIRQAEVLVAKARQIADA